MDNLNVFKLVEHVVDFIIVFLVVSTLWKATVYSFCKSLNGFFLNSYITFSEALKIPVSFAKHCSYLFS